MVIIQQIPNMENVQRKRSMAYNDKVKKKFKSIPVSSQASMTVINTGADGLGRTLLLRTAYDRYLFNCGEGSQKFIPEVARFSLGAVDNIFFTYNTWNNVGGVLAACNVDPGHTMDVQYDKDPYCVFREANDKPKGFLLSNTEQIEHTKSITLHGPPGVDKVVDISQMFSDAFDGHLATVKWRGIDKVKYEDDQVTVEYVEILPNVACKKEVRSDCQHEEASPSGNFEPREQKAETSHGMPKPLMAYIIRLKPLPRKVDPEKLFALNTKSGPWVKKLVSGEAVTLPDGRIVNPEDVLIDSPGQRERIAVIDCPTEDYLDSLISNKQIMDLSAEDNEDLEMIFHMAPASIIEDQRYKNFIDRFGSETTHLMLNENSPWPYVNISQMVPSALNYLHKGMFPLLHGSVQNCTKPKSQTGRIIQGCYGLMYTIRPKARKGFDWENLSYFDQSANLDYLKKKAQNKLNKLMQNAESEDIYVKALSLTETDVDSVFKRVASEIHAHEGEKDLSDEYPEIIFLGTGSAKPSCSRNASGILVQMRKDEYLMMDCGEGTLLQMYQMFGQEKTYYILTKLKGIFISHLHYDHHGGLFALLDARSKAFDEKEGSRLPIFAPDPLKRWLQYFSRQIAHQELNFEHVPNHVLNEKRKYSRDSYFISLAKNALNLSELDVVSVIHTRNSFGISMRHIDGWKLVYSGDTMPCMELVRQGKDCDILIHEGTFDDQSVQEAALKRHSTTGQAIRVGKQMNAKFIILTHFSQRFSKIPEISEDFTENVGFSFDFMKVRPSQLWLIPLLKPALEVLFMAELRKRISRQNNINMPEKKKKKDETMSSAAGTGLLAKLQRTERNEEITGNEPCIGNEPNIIDNESEVIGNEPDEKSVQNTDGNSNKRKAHDEVVWNKIMRTSENEPVATTSNLNVETVETVSSKILQ